MSNRIRLLEFENGQYTLNSFDGEIVSSKNVKEPILFPHFFNMHCHLGECDFMGLPGKNWTINKYLEYTNSVNDSISLRLQAERWNQSAEKSIKMISTNGIIGICAGRSAEICRQHDILNLSGYPLMKSRKLIKYYSDGLDGFKQYQETFSSPKCKVGVLIHSLYKVNNKMLELANSCMDMGASFICIHVSEDIETRAMEVKKYGKSPIDVLIDYGLLTSKTIIIHGGYLENEELKKISLMKASLAVCPISNIFLNTKIPNINLLDELGIRWFTTTDGIATGQTFSLIEQGNAIKIFTPDYPFSSIFKSFTKKPAEFWEYPNYTGDLIFNKGIGRALAINSSADKVEDFFIDLFMNKNEMLDVIAVSYKQ